MKISVRVLSVVWLFLSLWGYGVCAEGLGAESKRIKSKFIVSQKKMKSNIGDLILREGESLRLDHWKYGAETDSVLRHCHVPSLVHQNLISEGLLPDPHYRTNESLMGEASLKDWIYETELKIVEMPRGGARHYLEFDGIDTYGEVYLNGEKLGETENMFRAYRFEVSERLRLGQNRLVVRLRSPLRVAHPLYLSNGFDYPADNDHAPIRYSPFTRKAPYQYGWDWGMRLVSMGLWREVRLSSYATLRLESLRIDTKIDFSSDKLEAQKARLDIGLELDRWSEEEERIYFQLSVRDPYGRLIVEQIGDYEGMPLSVDIDKPHLWWVYEWGKPNLYEVRVSLFDRRGRALDKMSKRIGIRSLEFVNEEDESGRSFYFKLNGRPLFVRGTNYVPSDLMPSRRVESTFEQLIRDAKFANLNMIRIWGGGIYEDDALYDLADEQGLLLWQDFMFACTAYPSDRSFLENVRAEANYQIKRLRHHPSLALWCGNNEVDEAIKYWGWKSRYGDAIYQKLVDGYKPLFRELLQEEVRAEDPSRAYIHSSPMEANWGRKESFTYGDIHYWGLWYGREDFETFDDKPMRFVSEFGFQSFPSIKSLKTFALPEDLSLDSEVMQVHQKASTGNGLIRDYMQRYYRVPSGSEDFVYVGQIMQARGMAHSIRSQRYHRPVCMGSLYWQMNDTWPAVSWSSIDYYGNYKALHFALREAYAPVVLICRLGSNDGLEIVLANDLLDSIPQAILRLEGYSLSSGKRVEKSLPIKHIKANGLTTLCRESLNSLLGEEYRDYVLKATLSYGRDKEVCQYVYFNRPKSLSLPKARYQIEILERRMGYVRIRLSAQSFLKDMLLDHPLHGIRFSDNFFDLLPGESREVVLQHPKLGVSDKLNLEIRCLNDI